MEEFNEQLEGWLPRTEGQECFSEDIRIRLFTDCKFRPTSNTKSGKDRTLYVLSIFNNYTSFVEKRLCAFK